MKKEKFDDIRMNFWVSNEKFTDTIQKEFTISLVLFDETIQFETQYPDYIYNEAKKQYPDIYDQDFLNERLKEMTISGNIPISLANPKAKTKTLRSPLLEGIKLELESLSNKLIILNTFEDKNGEKVLFIYFNGHTSQQRDMNYGAGMGLLNSINFQYFVGYHFVGMIKKHLSEKEEMVEKYSAFFKCGLSESNRSEQYILDREKEMCPLHRTSRDKEILTNKYLIIPWTEEREQYLKDIQTNFTIMTDKLNEFLKDLTENKLDHLIENQPVRNLLTE